LTAEATKDNAVKTTEAATALRAAGGAMAAILRGPWLKDRDAHR